MVCIILSAKESVVFGGLGAEIFQPNFLRNAEWLTRLLNLCFLFRYRPLS